MGDDYKGLVPDPQAVAAHLPDWLRQWQREVAR